MSSELRESVGSCQDCGNKAKRECQHSRCRTCCKTRGFPCPTHVRSTWVPVSRRRHNHRRRLSLHLHPPNFSSSSEVGSVAGRNYQSLPAEINTLGNFRRVRMSSGDNAVNEVAYEASAMIGGHLFKGILYDQGLPGGGGVGSSAADHDQYQLAGMAEAAAHVGGGVGDSSGGYGYPLQEYTFYHASSSTSAQPYNASLLPHPGMQFFPNLKP